MRTEDATEIYDMAQAFLKKGHFNPKVKAILATGDPSSEDLSALITYISKCQNLLLGSINSNGLSIREMKCNLFRLIGHSFTDSRYAGSTVSRADLLAIYNFVIALPSECFDSEALM